MAFTISLSGKNVLEANDQTEEVRESVQVDHDAASNSGAPSLQVDPLRGWKTTAILCAWMGLGFGLSVLGPSLVSLELLFDTDTKTVASTFSYRSAGHFCGSLLCVVCYDRVTNKERLFAAACFLQGVCLSVAPFTGSIIVFICVFVVEGFPYSVALCSTEYSLVLWRDSKYKRTVLHACNLFWAAGSTFCPLVMQPFLPDLPSPDLDGTCGPPTNVTASTITEDKLTNWTMGVTTVFNTGCEANDTERTRVDVDVLKVRFSYPVIASVIVLAGILFGVLSFRSQTLPAARAQDHSDQAKNVTYLTTRKHTWIMYAFICTFCFLCSWVTMIPNVLLPVFAVKALGWSNADGSLIHAVFWGSNLATRALIVVIGTISPRLILFSGILLALLGNILLLFVYHNSWIVWLAVALTGIGISGQYIAFILWVSENMVFTGRANALVSVGFATRSMTGPAFAGFLFQSKTHMSLIYILVGTSTMILSVSLLLCCYFRVAGKHSRLTMVTDI